MEQLGELVVANERLAGRPVPKARQRVEFLKRRREVWEQIYNYFTKEEAAATLSTLEEANRQVQFQQNLLLSLSSLRSGSYPTSRKINC